MQDVLLLIALSIIYKNQHRCLISVQSLMKHPKTSSFAEANGTEVGLEEGEGHFAQRALPFHQPLRDSFQTAWGRYRSKRGTTGVMFSIQVVIWAGQPFLQLSQNCARKYSKSIQDCLLNGRVMNMQGLILGDCFHIYPLRVECFFKKRWP